MVIWRLDNGGAHDQGQFSCTLCQWRGKFYKNAAQYHAEKVHGGKATLQRKNPTKLSEEAKREANRQSQRRRRNRLKVRLSSFASLGSIDADDHAAPCSTGYSRKW